VIARQPFVVFHLEWDALLLGGLLPDAPTATFGDDRHRAAFAAGGLAEPLLMPPDLEILSTARLLDHPPIAEAIAARPHTLICFKPNARLEARAAALGATLAHAPARIGQGLENKLALTDLADQAGVPIPAPLKVTASEATYADLAATLGTTLVVQSPRGHARAGTVGAVVDEAGRVIVTAPIVQLTGLPELTPHPLGSCGNDFWWRPSPHPGDGPAELAEGLGPVLAARGYRGHFGVDFVFDGATTWLIEVNARFTATFALAASRRPELLHAHLAALRGEAITPTRLPPFRGGQMIARNGTATRQPPITAPGWQPHPSETVGVGGRLGRFLTDGELVAADGSLTVGLP